MTEDEHAQELWEAWRDYHKANPEIWTWFVRLTFRKINQRFKHYSADAIMHVVRFEVDVHPESSDGFKITNNHIAFYARLFVQEHPLYSKFFRLKHSLADRYFGDL